MKHSNSCYYLPEEIRHTEVNKKKMLSFFEESTLGCPVIAAINNDERLEKVCSSSCEIVYILYGNICNIAEIVEEVKECGKKAIVHVDLVTGFSSREIIIDFIKKYTSADGIISTKAHLIKRANELDLFTVQRFFMIDTITYQNVKRHVKESQPDIVEVMPAGLFKMIRYAKEEVGDMPLVASGLILDKEDVIGALDAGAMAVSTTNMDIWDMMNS